MRKSTTVNQNDNVDTDSDESIPDLDTAKAFEDQEKTQNSFGATPANVEETPKFESMKVADLKAILKSYGAKVSGSKADLVSRAVNYFTTKGHWDKNHRQSVQKEESSNDILQELTKKRKIFANSELNWCSIDSFPRSSLPEMEYQTIVTFMQDCYIDIGGESVPCGTEKPVSKGEHMYKSEKIQLCEYAIANDENVILFRANMSASMKTTEIR